MHRGVSAFASVLAGLEKFGQVFRVTGNLPVGLACPGGVGLGWIHR